MFLNSIFNLFNMIPCRLGQVDCGRDVCDAIRLRGCPSELCTLGLIEPGESVILVLSVLLSLR